MIESGWKWVNTDIAHSFSPIFCIWIFFLHQNAAFTCIISIDLSFSPSLLALFLSSSLIFLLPSLPFSLLFLFSPPSPTFSMLQLPSSVLFLLSYLSLSRFLPASSSSSSFHIFSFLYVITVFSFFQPAPALPDHLWCQEVVSRSRPLFSIG